jgi:hypothetical protein
LKGHRFSRAEIDAQVLGFTGCGKLITDSFVSGYDFSRADKAKK